MSARSSVPFISKDGKKRDPELMYTRNNALDRAGPAPAFKWPNPSCPGRFAAALELSSLQTSNQPSCNLLRWC
eukprot:scaffold2859_cov349-Pavlova_lutheri.AAC.49